MRIRLYSHLCRQDLWYSIICLIVQHVCYIEVDKKGSIESPFLSI